MRGSGSRGQLELLCLPADSEKDVCFLSSPVLLLQIFLYHLLQTGDTETKRCQGKDENSAVLAPDAVLLSLACSSCPAATPACGFSSCYIPVVIYTYHLCTHRWNCVLGGAAGCQRAGRHTRPARFGSLLVLAGVCCRGEVLPLQTVLALFRTTTWFRAAELFLQPGGAYVSLHRSGSLFPWKKTKDTFTSVLGNVNATAAISSSTPG